MVRWIELAGAKRQGQADGTLGIPYELGDQLGHGAPGTWDEKQVTFYLAELEALAGRRQARALVRAQAKARSLTPRLLKAAEAVLATDKVLSSNPTTSPQSATGAQWLSREAAVRARAENSKVAETERARERQKTEREQFIQLLGRLDAIVASAHKKARHHVTFANQTGQRYCAATARAYRKRAESSHNKAWSPPMIKQAAPWKDAEDNPSYEILLTKEAAELVRKAHQCVLQ
jgi:hypothetical protein